MLTDLNQRVLMQLRLACGAALAVFLTLNARAVDIHYVDASGTNPVSPYLSWDTAATNIQDAVVAAGGGDTVLVTNGVYQYGGIPVGGSNRVFTLYRAILLQSVNGPAATIIQGHQVPGTTNGASAIRCVYLTPGATLSGFTVTGGATAMTSYGGGVVCSGTNCYVTNCVIINNSADNGGGGVYQGTVVNCVLTGNSTSPASYGNGGGASYSTLVNCVLAGNFAGYNGGGAAWCTLINCTVVGNVSAAYAGSVAGCTLKNCIVYYNFNYYTNTDNNSGYILTNCCVSFPTNKISGVNNFTNLPLFANLSAGDYHLNAASPCINAGKNAFMTNATDLDGNPRLIGGVVDVGAYEFQSPVHYVKTVLAGATPVSPFTNWVTAATNIQDAVDAANAGDFVVVSNGVYGTGGRVVYGNSTNRVVVDKPVTLQSVNGPATTAIQGYSFRSSSIRCVYLTNNAALLGFTITNGGAMDSGDVLREQSGGGVWCEDSSVLVSNCVIVHGFAYENGGGAYQGMLANCILANNTADQYGGGAFQGALFNCVLTNNSAYHGGGACSNVLTGCTLVKNFAQFQNLDSGGGAIYSSLSNCLIIANNSWGGGGGAAFSTLSGCVVSNNTGNTAGGGVCGGIANNCLISSNQTFNMGGGAYSNILNNCLLRNNLASSVGGGAYQSSLVNCTIVSNAASGPSLQPTGGGLYGGNASNCIIYYNLALKDPNISGTGPMAYCCTTPLPAGSGNLTNEPVFVDLVNGDLHLQSSSPCINAGNNACVTGASDLDGNSRIVGGRVDLGAYEYQSPTTVTFYASLEPPTNNISGSTITWQSVNGVSYFIQRSGELSAQPPFSTIQSNVIGLPGTTSYTDTNAIGDGPFFYRVGVQP